MEDFSAIDTFLETFTRYIDSGFGLIEGDIASLASILIVIDVTLAALFWAWGEQEEVLRNLVRKTLHVGAFASSLVSFSRFQTSCSRVSQSSASRPAMRRSDRRTCSGLALSQPKA